MERRLHLLESFTAKGSDGAMYKVHGYEHLARDESFVSALDRWEPTGVAEYRLADGGERVEVRPDGSLHVPGSGVTLTRQ